MSIVDELQKLQQLHQAGTINDAEFAQAKAKLLQTPSAEPPFATPSAEPRAAASAPPPPPHAFATHLPSEHETRQWSMFVHLSQLANLFIPPAGLIAPIVLWQIKKPEMPGIDPHGKVVVNWILSSLIYLFICVVLSFILIGIPLLLILIVLDIVFPIIGGIKANNGEIWPYPLSITFLPVTTDEPQTLTPAVFQSEPGPVSAEPTEPDRETGESCPSCGRGMVADRCPTCGWTKIKSAEKP